MNLITIIVGGATALAVATGGAPAEKQGEAAGFARKALRLAQRPTHTLPAVEKFLGKFNGANAGAVQGFAERRVSLKQIREQLGDPTTVSHTGGTHWIYRLDDGAMIRISSYGPRGPIYEITTLDPATKQAKKWLYFAGC